MHHTTYRIAHTMAFVSPVVEHWLEREIAQWVHPMKQRCQLVQFTCKPYRSLRFAWAYGRTMQSLRIFMIFADSNLNHSTLYIQTVVSLLWHQLCFVKTKVNDLWYNKLCFVCLLYMGVLQWDPIPKLCFAMVLTICKDFFADRKDFLS